MALQKINMSTIITLSNTELQYLPKSYNNQLEFKL